MLGVPGRKPARFGDGLFITEGIARRGPVADRQHRIITGPQQNHETITGNPVWPPPRKMIARHTGRHAFNINRIKEKSPPERIRSRTELQLLSLMPRKRIGRAVTRRKGFSRRAKWDSRYQTDPSDCDDRGPTPVLDRVQTVIPPANLYHAANTARDLIYLLGAMPALALYNPGEEPALSIGKSCKTRLTAEEWGLIRQCPIMAALPDEDVQQLIGAQRAHAYDANQTIFSQGHPADAFYIVVEGWVKVFRITPSGQEAVVSVFAKGESFAEPVMFLGGYYPASAEAASAVRLIRIDAADFAALMEKKPALATAMLASIARHTEELSDEILGLKLLSAPRRLAEFLNRLTPAGANAAEVRLPHEKNLLARRLGMTPESLSRSLAALRQLGVCVDRDCVSIPDVQALALYSRQIGRTSRTGHPDTL